MMRATQVLLLAFLIVATLAVAAIGWAAWRTERLIAGVDARVNGKTGILARAEGLETKANATLVNLDKGTALWAASAKDQAGAIQDLATDAHGTLSEADTTLRSVGGVAKHAEGTADAAASLLASAQRATDEIPGTLHHVDDVLVDSRSLLSAGTAAETDLRTLLEDHAIEQTLANVQGMTDSGNGILADARKVADKETADWLRPVPWWKQPIAKAGALIDITAAVARHTP